MSSLRLVLSAALLSKAWGLSPAAQAACFTPGSVYTGTYNGANVSTKTWPNAAFATDITHCQQSCKTMGSLCEAFSYQAAAGTTWGPGACWVFGPDATLKTTAEGGAISTDFTSGPSSCPGAEGTAAPLLPGTVPFVEAPLITTSTTPTNGTAVAEATGVGGFPWWAMLLIGLGVAAAGLLAYFFLCKKESAPKKNKSKRSVKETEVIAEPLVTEAAEESQPLMMATRVPAPELLSTVAMPMPQYTTAVPMAMYAPAMPTATYASAAPQYVVQAPQYMQQAPQYVVQGTQPTYMSGAQPVYTATTQPMV